MKYMMLKEVCSIKMGQSPASDSYNDNGEGIPFFQGNADFGERYPVARQWCSAPIKMAEPEDILISVRAPIGALNYAKEECCIGRGLAALTPNKSKISPEFMFWLLKGKTAELNSKGTGSTFKAISRKVLEEILVPDIGIDQQAEYSAILEKINGIIQLRKQELQKLDELIKSRFIEMFGDPMTNPHNLPKVILGSVLTIEPQNGLYKPQSDYVSDGTGVPILRIDSFYEGKVSNLSSLRRLICSEIELKRYSLYENDIVINRVNSIEYLGKCGLIQGLVENTVFESNMMRLHVDEHKFHPVYITKLLCSEFIYQQILRRAKKAVNQASINQKDVQSFVVYMPPIEQQDQFAAFVKQTDKSKLAIQKSLEKLEILKKALMQKYFG